jgi:hypothetical protein
MSKEIAGFKFITEKGFCSELVTTATVVDVPVATEEIIEKKEVVQMKRTETIDVPDFMKARSSKLVAEQRKAANKVVYLYNKDDSQKEDEEKSVPEKMVDGLIKVGRNVLTKNPVFKYFFDDYREVKKDEEDRK